MMYSWLKAILVKASERSRFRGPTSMHTCTKIFADIPFAHRQHTHTGHCRFIHGHNWTFELEFTARELDPCGFVIDFGGDVMKGVKTWLTETFDHKLALNEADPMRLYLQSALFNAKPLGGDGPEYQLADVIVVPDGSAEGLAKWVFRCISERVYASTKGRVNLKRVTVREDSKNSASFQP